MAVTWQGNLGAGTEDYRAYGRDHLIGAAGKADIAGSADPAFRGDATRWNPEDLLVASLSACHKLWYLHLCATSGISVLAYQDNAVGVMREDAARGGFFTSVTLRPQSRCATATICSWRNSCMRRRITCALSPTR